MARRGAVAGIKLSGLEDVIKELQARDMDVKAGLVAICDAGAQVVEDEIQERAPGRLAEATARRVRDRSATKVAVDVGFVRKQSFIARFLEFGTRPHIIKVRPRKRGAKKALYFNGVWRRQVNHPGAKKKPFIRPGFEAAAGEATDAIGRETKRVLSA